MNKLSIYLAGPISGTSYGVSTDWRKDVADRLGAMSNGRIECFSPMRHKEYLKGENRIGDSYDMVLSNQRGITARDRFDCMRADLIFVNFLSEIAATKPSLGTVMEIAWGDMLRKPIVLCMEDKDNVHDHAMIRECCPFRTNNLDEAIDTAFKILIP